MLRCFLALVITLASGTTRPLGAQPTALGRISFPTSGRAEAQPAFVRGVLFLHSFEYDSAARWFREAQRLDPNFAMAFWGEAMTYTHPVWFRQDLAAGRAVLQRLAPTPAERRARALTSREKRWLDAVEVLYGEGSKTARDTLYARTMERFARDMPGDHEVQVFHALALLGLSSTGRDIATYMRAAAIAEEVLRDNAEHPGALHVAIHAYDDPIHAPLGLRAARAYGAVAPGAAHARHMTSHIFMALGQWDDVEQANVAALEAAGGRNGHFALWLAYAYLQQGRLRDAARLVGDALSLTPATADPSAVASMNHLLAAWIIDTEDWTHAWARAADTTRRAGTAGAYRVEGLQLDFAAALAALRRGEVGTTLRLRASMRERTSASRLAAGDAHVPGLAAGEVMITLLDALMLAREGTLDSAIVVARAAAEREESLPFEYGPPEVVKPSWEVTGELLLVAGRAGEARDAFDRALRRAPNRSRSVLGLARAWASLADEVNGAQHYARFLANCAGSDERTPARSEAEQYLARVVKR